MTDILALLGKDVPQGRYRKVATTDGGEYAGPCPWCGGDDRFRVWPGKDSTGRYWCRVCNRKGDGIQYLREKRGLSFHEACHEVGITPTQTSSHTNTKSRRLQSLAISEPSLAWQAKAAEFVKKSEQTLWSRPGAFALDRLRSRALSDATIQNARMGYNPTNLYEKRDAWGLPELEDSKRVKRDKLWLPRGLVIPWILDKTLWQVRIRRLNRDIEAGEGLRIKYKALAPRGVIPLYNAGAISGSTPVVLLEGEIDCLTVLQVAGDVATAVATGGTTQARRPRWIAKLALASLVLVAFDSDQPGEKAAEYWLSVLPNARRWRPYWADVNQMAQDGADVREWVLAGIK